METLSGETVAHRSDIIFSFELVHRSGTMFALLQSIEILHPAQAKRSNPPLCGKPNMHQMPYSLSTENGQMLQVCPG